MLLGVGPLEMVARIRVTVRKIWVAMAQACPYAELFRRAVANLRSPPPR